MIVFRQWREEKHSEHNKQYYRHVQNNDFTQVWAGERERTRASVPEPRGTHGGKKMTTTITTFEIVVLVCF
jgi:hypothetical protein